MKKAWTIGIIIVALIAIAIFTKGFGLFSPTGAVVKSGGEITGEMKIPLSEISEDAKFYEYTSDGTTIRFFAVKADDGSIKTGFDACDVCYRSGKGYRQEGKYMVCNNCDNKYPISGLGTKNKNPGGCWPGFLPSSVNGDSLVIEKSNLEKGILRFR